MTPSGRDHSDLEPGPNPSRVIFTLRASQADLTVLGCQPVLPRHAIDFSRRWQAGRYPPACLDLGGPAPGSCRRLLPVPDSPPMQVCFPRAIRPGQRHSIFSGLISAAQRDLSPPPSLVAYRPTLNFWWNVPVNGILTSFERVVPSPCLFDSYFRQCCDRLWLERDSGSKNCRWIIHLHGVGCL